MTRREQPYVRISKADQLLSVIPVMLGFTPEDSLVVIGITREGRMGVAFRYDLPAMNDMPSVTEHATTVLARNDTALAMAIGYGPGSRVTPRMDAFRRGAAQAGLTVHDALRVDEGRYWSYVRPDAHPVEGTPLDAARLPPGQLARLGNARASREELVATLAPVAGREQDEMWQARAEANREFARAYAAGGRQAFVEHGLKAVRTAVDTYRDGGQISDTDHARIQAAMRDLQVRDDAWARMDPQHAEAHQRLWTDSVRRALPGYGAAPASLLAYTAYQRGNGALANIALDRAEEDTPGYSMASLLRQALDAGVPPSAMSMSMTPEDVAASYADRGAQDPGSPASAGGSDAEPEAEAG